MKKIVIPIHISRKFDNFLRNKDLMFRKKRLQCKVCTNNDVPYEKTTPIFVADGTHRRDDASRSRCGCGIDPQTRAGVEPR